MTEPRPHRPALPPAAAAAELQREATAGRLHPDAVAAVLKAAGHRGEQVRAPHPSGLSDREAQVLGMLARGWSTKQIARQLDISPKTCDHHIQRVYRKIGVRTRAGAALFAVEHGILPPPERTSPE
jgi:DNA-binding NarL/FixJ family response regulator